MKTTLIMLAMMGLVMGATGVQGQEPCTGGFGCFAFETLERVQDEVEPMSECLANDINERISGIDPTSPLNSEPEPQAESRPCWT